MKPRLRPAPVGLVVLLLSLVLALSFPGSAGAAGAGAQSQINLSAVGVTAGDNIRLRFDFGRDGCGGRDGWYVDNFTVQSCNAKKQPPS